MIGRRAVIGLSLLSALVFCAFAAQSASAAETESANTTAFTCIEKVGSGDFTDAHCDKPGVGNFAHELIPLNTKTKIGGNNQKVTGATDKIESAVLRGKIGLTATEITCRDYVIDEKESWIENTEPKVGDHKVKGTVRAEFKVCEVKKPAKCTVDEPIEATANFVGVDGMRDPVTKGKENAMGLRFEGEKVFEGKTETFASITYRGAECALKDKTFPVTGTAIGTAGPGTTEDQENKHSGATTVFQPVSGEEKISMQKLHLGNEANKAEFETIATTKMAENGKPIALTTTT